VDQYRDHGGNISIDGSERMSTSAIRARSLTKIYRLGAHVERYSTFRDTLANAIKHPFRRLRSRSKEKNEDTTLWALKNVDFDIGYGEVVGVIGRNGAGKSTLLKILSRITEPTAGWAEIRGRVGSLLEVGTGFHLELTGRENIYLNGAILGMRRSEIERKFDEMIDFSGVEKFIDTPVKHYSSGMYLRLAFAVAAHLEPEILLVDEVLAVGDAAFQRKCIGKMNDVAAQGRTVLFVSHNLGAVKELCTSALVMSNGEVGFRGPVSEGLAYYSRNLNDSEPSEGASGTLWRTVDVNEGSRRSSVEVRRDEPLSIDARLDLKQDYPSGQIVFLIDNAFGDTVVNHRIRVGSPVCPPLGRGSQAIRVQLPALWLAPGVYTAYFKFLGVTDEGRHERHISNRSVFDVPGSLEDIGRALLAPDCRWEFSQVGGSRACSSEVLA
jgi:lipopolysaccharide transport system ATP-binding protein